MAKKYIDQEETLNKLKFLFDDAEGTNKESLAIQNGIMQAMLVVILMDTAEAVERGNVPNDETTCV